MVFLIVMGVFCVVWVLFLVIVSKFLVCSWVMVVFNMIWVYVLVSGIVVVLDINGMVWFVFGLVFRM